MRLPKIVLPVLLFAGLALAQANPPANQALIPKNDAERYGLQGPVKSVLKQSDRHLVFMTAGPYAATYQPLECIVPQRTATGQMIERSNCIRPTPGLLERSSSSPLPLPNSPAWIVFDEAGMTIEMGAVGSEGFISHVTKFIRDADEQVVKRIFNASSNTPTVQKLEPAPIHDAQATAKDTYSSIDAKLLVHSETTSDGNVAQARFYNAKDQPDGDRLDSADANTLTRYVRNEDGSVRTKIVQRKDDKGILTEWSEYDGTEKLMRTLRFADGKLNYGFQDASDKRPYVWGVKTLGHGKSYTWVLFPGGGWETWVTNHPNSLATDPENIERVDQNGTVLERLSLEYVRDAQGNWTTMKASDWKRETNKTVLVETDTRKIEYFEMQAGVRP